MYQGYATQLNGFNTNNDKTTPINMIGAIPVPFLPTQPNLLYLQQQHQQQQQALLNNINNVNNNTNNNNNNNNNNNMDNNNNNDNNNIDNNETTSTKNKLPVDHDAFYNMKPLLAENILSSDYFKSLYRFKTYIEVVEEGKRFVKNLEPLMVGLSRKPSTAFCVLYKLMTLNLTIKQINSLIDPIKQDNNYIRGIGFLYLRYLLPRKLLWKWYENYFDDDTEFAPGSDGKPIKMGTFIKNLIEQQKYYTTLLPRIPVKIERAYKKRLLQKELIKKRDGINEKFRHKLKEQMIIDAQWRDFKYYKAKITELLQDGLIKVLFIDYDDDEEELVSIGQIKLLNNNNSDASKSSDTDNSDSDRNSNDSHGHNKQHKSDIYSSDDERKHHKRKYRSRDHDRRDRHVRHHHYHHRYSHSRSKSSEYDKRRHHHHRHKSRKRRHDTRSRSREYKRKRDRNGKKYRDRDRMDRIDRDRDRDRDRRRKDKKRGRKYSDNIMNDDDILNEKNLDKIIQKRERDKVVAKGRDYARRPTAYYHSLTLDLETGTNRKRSPEPSNVIKKKKKRDDIKPKIIKNKMPSKEWLEQQQKLKAIYGDASSKKT